MLPYSTLFETRKYAYILMLVLTGCSEDYGNKYSAQANQCMQLLKTLNQVPVQAVLDGEIRSVPLRHYTDLKHKHVYVSFTLPQQRESTWNMCILDDGVLAKNSESIVAEEIDTYIEACKLSTPCVKDCGMRWATHAKPTDDITLDWRRNHCTPAKGQYIVRRPSYLEMRSRH